MGIKLTGLIQHLICGHGDKQACQAEDALPSNLIGMLWGRFAMLRLNFAEVTGSQIVILSFQQVNIMKCKGNAHVSFIWEVDFLVAVRDPPNN